MKHLFIGGRGSGKTTAIINWLREDETRAVVVRNQMEQSIYLNAGIPPQQILFDLREVRGRAGDWAIERDDTRMGPNFQHRVTCG